MTRKWVCRSVIALAWVSSAIAAAPGAVPSTAPCIVPPAPPRSAAPLPQDPGAPAAAPHGAGERAGAPARRTIPGRVLLADGTPAAGAEVTCVRVRGGADVVRATGDEQGRFRVSLQPCEEYLAWAVHRRDGKAVVTPAQTVSPGILELRVAADARPAPERIKVRGLDKWREWGPFTATLALGEGAVVVGSVPVAENGTLSVPPLPSDLSMLLDLHTADGRWIESPMWSWQASRRIQPQSSPLVQPPQRVRALVVDEAGKPVADAVISHLSWRYSDTERLLPSPLAVTQWRAAVTDAEGRAEVLVATTKDLFGDDSDYRMIHFMAAAPGRAPAFSGRAQSLYLDRKVATEAEREAKELRFTLRPAKPTKGRIEAAAGRMPRHVARAAMVSVPMDGDSTTGTGLRERFAVAADGSFAMPVLDDEHDLESLSIPDVAPPLEADDPYARAAVVTALPLPIAAAEGDLRVDLRPLTALRLAVLDVGKAPARGADVVCSPDLGGRYLDPRHAMQARTDASGRLALPVLPGRWVVAVVREGEFACVEIDVGHDRPPPQTVQLEPLPRMPLRVIGPSGAPIADATFMMSGGSMGGGHGALVDFRQQLAWDVATWHLARARTDAEGRCSIAFLESTDVEVTFRVHSGRASVDDVVLRAGEAPLDIVLK